MLIIHGKPVLNCLDFYDRFDLDDILSQPEAFTAFAKGHLQFSECSRRCIALFESASHMEELPINSETDFWQTSAIPDCSPMAKSIIGETYVYLKSKGGDHWKNNFVMTAAACILGEQKFSIPQKTKAPVRNASETLNIENSKISVKPGKEYTVPNKLGIESDQPRKLHVTEISAKDGYTGAAVLNLGRNRMINLQSGHSVFLIADENQAAAVLPDEISLETGKLKRDYRQNCITFNGKPTDIPLGASSFIALGEGRFMYLEREKLFLLGNISDEEVPRQIQNGGGYVDLRLHRNQYYLLTNEGQVCNHQGIQWKIRRNDVSLEDALREMGE